MGFAQIVLALRPPVLGTARARCPREALSRALGGARRHRVLGARGRSSFQTLRQGTARHESTGTGVCSRHLRRSVRGGAVRPAPAGRIPPAADRPPRRALTSSLPGLCPRILPTGGVRSITLTRHVKHARTAPLPSAGRRTGGRAPASPRTLESSASDPSFATSGAGMGRAPQQSSNANRYWRTFPWHS